MKPKARKFKKKKKKKKEEKKKKRVKINEIENKKKQADMREVLSLYIPQISKE